MRACEKTMTEFVSPYKRGADKGLYFGIWLTVMFFAVIFSVNVEILSFVAMLMFVATPVIVYRWLRQTYVAENGATPLSGLWMQGIMIFACGSLINALVATVYLKWVNPGYVMERINDAIAIYSALDDPTAREAADLMTRMVEAHAVPSIPAIAVEMVWIAIFTGSVLSLFLSLLARARKVESQNN